MDCVISKQKLPNNSPHLRMLGGEYSCTQQARPSKQKHLHYIYTILDQRLRQWAALYKCYTNVLCLLGGGGWGGIQQCWYKASSVTGSVPTLTSIDSMFCVCWEGRRVHDTINMSISSNVVLMLGQRLRGRASIKTTLVHCLVFPNNALFFY